MGFISEYREELERLIKGVSETEIGRVARVIEDAGAQGRQIFIIGNGGSAATASHFACDLAKGTVRDVHDESEQRIRVISLTDNVAHMTAIGNDLAYDEIFAQQLRNLARAGDVVIAFSASGNSPNIVKAVEFASRLGATTVGFTGFSGGKLRKLADHCIHIPSERYGPIEDMHLVLVHMISNGIADRRQRARSEVSP